jgi:hypothetical protein
MLAFYSDRAERESRSIRGDRGILTLSAARFMPFSLKL